MVCLSTEEEAMALKACGEKNIKFENMGRQSTWLKAILMQQNQYEYEWINRESLCRLWFLWRMYLHSSDNRPQLMFVRDAVVYKQFIEDNMISPSNGIWICFRLSERGVGQYCFIGHLRCCQPILVSHALVRQIYNVHLSTKVRTLHRRCPRKNKDFSPPKPEVMGEI